MSAALNLRYPDAVLAGVTSPSASRKRILEMVTSANSARRSCSTSPMLLPPTVRSGLTTGVVDQAVLADLHLVAVRQLQLVDPVAVHIGAVQAADVADLDALRVAAELGVPARDGDVVEEDVAVRVPAG